MTVNGKRLLLCIIFVFVLFYCLVLCICCESSYITGHRQYSCCHRSVVNINCNYQLGSDLVAVLIGITRSKTKILSLKTFSWVLVTDRDAAFDVFEAELIKVNYVYLFNQIRNLLREQLSLLNAHQILIKINTLASQPPGSCLSWS